ncbi:MAG: 4'-phosphopantetheinyl transferase superfamily protein [Chitinophagaceae bacterium]|nr:4'-phosphopantetheinyl transferase superfamily protein [Chitinophagaceae bacterium]
MALFYQHTINGGTKLGIWRIEEPEEFFLEKVPLKRDVSHPYKRLQHLAGRYLLPALFEDFPLQEILIADTNKPFLEDEQYHFSISHSGNFAAAIVSDHQRVGVDIELVTPRIKIIGPKFLNDAENLFLKNYEHFPGLHLELTTILWSAKESLFKWYGEGKVDFKNHMQLDGAVSFRPNEWIDLPFLFNKDNPMQLTVSARIFDGLVLAFVHS